ncbi:uncharacterized protein LOC124253552 isoform X2 [Haliotis rubra]|uniref:uncharacterized protein LOC124253552 isoform X2 n=1 Tax=Haliotis rubra TaxID=36100 RepID=UPI001EE50CCD|nr:uncharacterized protein LOC124253552 isoform X2 [Haliotis rubra]
MSSSKDSGPRESGTNISLNVAGVQGGSVGQSAVTGCTFGPHTIVNRFENVTVNPNDLKVDSLQGCTEREITNKTHHCIKTRALTKVVEKCQGNRKCVTITGLPGDGKTTLAYMALRELKKQAKVFAVHTKSDYFSITAAGISQDIYILIDDIFGLSVFEKKRLQKWRDVLEDVLTDRRSDRIHSDFRCIKLLLVCRINVMNEAQNFLDKFETLVNCEDSLIDLSSPSYKLSFEEKVQIFEVYSQKRIDEETRDVVCSLSTSHGFPNCCEMFFSMMKQFNWKATEFFRNPVSFLMESTKALIAQKASYKLLFEELIQMGGELDLSTIRQKRPLLTDEDRREAINELKGSFIEEQRNIVVFKYPTILARVTTLLDKLRT